MQAAMKTDIDRAGVTRQVSAISEEALKIAAFRTTEIAQSNIRDNNQIDTGFMVNAVYPIWKGGSDHEKARSKAEECTTGRDGRQVDHSGDMAPDEPLIPGAGAAVVAGANYSIYQEALKPFLYPAGERVSEEMGVIVASKVKLGND